ncbi:hypothetical protein Q7P35_008154 [Cladosporium inversicolor]
MALAAAPPAGMTDPTQRRFRGAARINEYEVMKEKLGEGTFGVVSKGISKRSGKVFALKKILMHNEKDGFPITALREVKLLKMLSHPNILKLEEMAVERQAADEKGSKGKKRATLYMVSPYADHDLSGMLTNPDIRFSEAQIKCYMQQLLEGLRYLHDSHILHRDMKAANILISNSGILQIADFGLARHYEGLVPQPGKGNGEAVRDYTSLVVTRWYRPPELLLTLKKYTPAIDMWGVGCVFGEMFERKPILEGRTDIDQCVRIFKLVGSPTETTMPGWSSLPGCEGQKEWEQKRGDIDQRFGQHLKPEGLDLLKSLLCLDYKKRINAFDALQHDYFKVAPLPARPEDLPRYQDSHELDSRRRGQEKKNNLPPAPAGGTVGMGPDEWNPQGVTTAAMAITTVLCTVAGIAGLLDLHAHATTTGEDLHHLILPGRHHSGARTGALLRLQTAMAYHLHQHTCPAAPTSSCRLIVARPYRHLQLRVARVAVVRLMSTPTYQATIHAQTTEATADVEAPEILIATRMQCHPQEATGTTRLEEATETWTGRPPKGIRTASVIRTADTTDPDVHAAGALNTTTTAEQDCKTARRTFMRDRCFASNGECNV